MSNTSADSGESILKIEGLLGKPLPTEYRDWLSDDESSFVTPNKVTIPADPPWIDTVSDIYRTDEVIRYLEMEQEMEAVGSRDFPEGMFPIAENGMGDHYLMSMRDADFGSIFFLFHEETNSDDGLWGLHPMGSGFNSWLDTFEEDVPVQKYSAPPQIATPVRSPATKKQPKPWWRFW